MTEPTVETVAVPTAPGTDATPAPLSEQTAPAADAPTDPVAPVELTGTPFNAHNTDADAHRADVDKWSADDVRQWLADHPEDAAGMIAPAPLSEAATAAATAPEAVFAAHTDPVPDVVTSTDRRDAGSTQTMPLNPTAPQDLGEAAVPHDLQIDATAGANVVQDWSAPEASDKLDEDARLADIHTKVTEIHAMVAQFASALPEIVKALEASPLGRMLGGMFK